jgi:uncharacterized protein YvpB
MYTAKQAREDVTKYEDEVRINTLENLLKKQDNEIALQIFEAEIESLANKGYTTLLINHLKPELFKLCETTDINLILKYMGYSIETNYKFYKITW